MPKENKAGELEDVNAGQLFKWDEPKTLAGVKLSYRVQQTSKGPGNIYELQTKDGLVPFFAPKLLHDKIKNIPLGYFIEIEYIGESKTMSGNTVKNFNVKKGLLNDEQLKARDIDMEGISTVSLDDIK